MLIGFFTTTHTYTVLYVLKCAFVVLGFLDFVHQFLDWYFHHLMRSLYNANRCQ